METKNITFLIPSMNGGGIQKVTLLVANELCKRGWQVTFLMCNVEGVYLKRLDERVKIIPLSRRKISRNLFEVVKYLKQSKPAILYSSATYVNTIAGLAVILANFRGKIFFSEHMNFSARSSSNKTMLNKVSIFLAKIVYRKADVVVCVSDGVKKDLNSVIKNLKKVIVINNPVESFFREKKLNSDKFKIISMGRLEKEKNFNVLIEAFKILLNKTKNNNIELYIAGEGKEKIDLQKQVNQLGLENNVFFTGFVDDPGGLLSSSDLFVLASSREGLPNVLIEALSCGLPVISTDCPSGPSEILKEGKLGKLIPVDDKESLATAIAEAINAPNKYSTEEERIMRAREFSVVNIVDQYEMIFKEVVDA